MHPNFSAPTSDSRKPITRAVLSRIVALFAPHWRSVTFVFGAVLVTSFVGLINPLVVRAIVDKAIPNHDLKQLATLAIIMVAATVLGGFIDTAETYVNTRTGQAVLFELRAKLYAHLQRMSLRFFTETRTGEIMARITADITGVQDVVTTTASEVLHNLVVVLSTLGLMLALDWRLALVCVAMMPLFVWPTKKAGEIRRRLSKEAQKKTADLSAVLDETLSVSGALLTKTFGRQSREVERFSAVSNDLLQLEIKRTMLSQLFWVTIQTFWAVSPALIYYFGGRGVVSGATTIGGVIAFVTLQNRLFFPLGRLFGIQVQIHSSLALFDRIFEYLDLPIEIAERADAKALQVTSAEVNFDRVSFGYAGTGTETALRTTVTDISFRARPGTLTALVGPSGAGKTTLTYLLQRLYDVQNGAITIDGQDLRDVTLSSLSEAIGVVTQETFLFHASVRDNLRYARPNATDAEIHAAAAAAQIHEHIAQLPAGYDTIVGERGYKLSGGERQRLAIARVILKAAPIVILDEATSSLDTVSEKLVQSALVPLTNGRTTLAIAHRLSTVLSADQILVFDHGQLIEHGTHDELYRQKGLYARLFDEQFAGRQHQYTKPSEGSAPPATDSLGTASLIHAVPARP